MAKLYPWQMDQEGAGGPGVVNPPPGPSSVVGQPAGYTPYQETGGTGGSGGGGGTPSSTGGAGSSPFSFGSSIFNFSQLPGKVSTFKEPNYYGLPGNIAEGLKKMMAGETRFNPAVMEALKGKLLGTTEARKAVMGDQIKDAAVQEGTYRSGQTGEDIREAITGAESQYASGVRDIELQKVNADYEDKVAAFDRAQKYLDSSRAYALSVDANQIERDRLMSSLTLAYAKLQEDREALEYDRWKTLLNREPIEGRDWIWGTDTNGNRTKIWLAALNAGNTMLG